MEYSEKIDIQKISAEITKELKKVIIEQDELLEQSLVVLFSGGHVLLEGVPGLAKTLFVKTLAEIMSVNFKRIQITPDLMPSDITGTKIFNMQSTEFELKKGPVFTNLLLADEINRTPPKTQAGLLEAMGENTVTIDGDSIVLPKPYMIFATQNPLEYEGTYPLPEALVDRFLMKVLIDYPTQTCEKEIIKRYNSGEFGFDVLNYNLEKVCTAEDLERCRKEVQRVKVDDDLMTYIVSIVSETRTSAMIDIGSSPRGTISLLLCSKAYAALHGRDYIIPEDIKKMALPALRHRITLKPELEIEGAKPDDILSEILAKIKVPR